jgi:putative ABC transport system permease protein
VRQLLTEAIVLSLAGAALGVLLARLALDATLPLVPERALAQTAGIVIDTRVMAFCLGLSLLTSVLIGLVPALRISGVTFGEGRWLQGGATRATGDRQGERLRTLLVATQIALTLVLLIGAGLLIHSFLRLTAVSPGFASSDARGHVQTIRVTLPERLYEEPARIHAFARGVLDRIQYLPGVHSASLTNMAPFGSMFIKGDFGIEGQPPPKLDVGMPKIEAGYFKTMGIRLLAGREFTSGDTAEAPKVAILSERVAREYFPGGPANALGRRVFMGQDGDPLTVVGVVADIRQFGLDDREPEAMLYVPFQQERAQFFIRFVAFVVRTSAPASVIQGVRAEIRRAAPDLPIESTVTMDEAVAASVAQPRLRMLLLALFAIAATLIATCGIYGLMAYAVTQRRREIGVRMALGAEGRDVLRLVLARALRVVIAGVLIGLAGAFAVTRVLQAFLFGVTPTDPIAFTVVTFALMTIGLTAAWLPARRATRIDPVAALRAE